MNASTAASHHNRQPAAAPSPRRAVLLVLDSVGIGAAPDAAAYGDTGADTLGHIAEAAGGLRLPHLQALGLGCIRHVLKLPQLHGVPPVETPAASYGALQELSQGKDTTTGHWELAGLLLAHGFHVFDPSSPSFPGELTDAFVARTGRGILGNRAASGTAIIEELGAEQMQTGAWIVYTSADSVFQVAAHEEVIPLDELYRGCEIARELCNPYRVGRVIARPFVGKPGTFTRTDNRRDFSYPLPEPTLLDRLTAHGIPVTTIGKLDDIFAGQGITTPIHLENSADAQQATLEQLRRDAKGLIFVNLIDFDMRYGHRRDPMGYAGALVATDGFIGSLLELLTPDDLLIITADHGNDPTFHGTDHTREYVPLLVGRQASGVGTCLGIRKGFYNVAQSLAAFFGIPPMERGRSFLSAAATAPRSVPAPPGAPR